MTQPVPITRHAAPAAAATPNWQSLLKLFILLAIALIAINWTTIHAVNVELGDFAANSLLIQDAKSLSLFKGNYSRVGFNHPGPAILYVLAFGEVVFHDWLHLAPSPFSGQLIGVALYSALWLTLMFDGLRKLSGSSAAAALTLAVFAFAAALLDHQVFLGIWFPHLYFLPFAAMLVAATRFAEGHADTLPSLALASGFLVNGHVSFVAILGIILLTVLAASLFRARRQGGTPFLLSRQFVVAHRRNLLAFFVIFALFLVPLLIETILRFPGPLADYAAFSGKNKANSLGQAIRFMAVYWGASGFSALFGLLMILMLWMHAGAAGHVLRRTVRAAIVVFCGATLALLFYAKFGVDMLDQSYIGLFYYAVPALTAALAALCIWWVIEPARQGIVALVVTLLLAAGTAYLLQQPVGYASQYNEPGVPQMYERLKSLPHYGRLVLDLDYSKDANFVWSRVLGIETYGKRRKDQFICLNQNWHISSTASARCTEQEAAAGPRYMVRMTEQGAAAPVTEGIGLSVYRIASPDLIKSPVATLAGQRELFKSYFLGTGWSDPEGEFVWSQATEAHLVLQLLPGFTGTLELDLGAFLPRPDSIQTITVNAGAGESAPQVFNPAQQRRQIRVPLHARADGRADVTLHIQRPVSPSELGLSQDTRQLGVSLYGFKIEGT